MSESENSIIDSIANLSWRSGASVHSAEASVRGGKPEYVTPVLAKKEQTAVTRAKCLVVMALMLAATALTPTAYAFISREETKDFENQFQNYASEIISVSEKTIDTTLASLQSFTLTLSSYAASRNQPWPYVTIPDFSKRAEALAQMTGATRVWMFTVVEDERSAWEEYSRDNVAKWYEDSIRNEGGPEEGLPSLDFYLNRTSPVIFWVTPGDLEPHVESGEGPWLPLLHYYPLTTEETLTNFNALKTVNGDWIWRLTHTTHQPVLFFNALFDTVESSIFQPVFESVYGDPAGNKIVSYVTLAFDWSTFFSNILHEGEGPLALVIQNSCSKSDTVTFELNGPQVLLVGPGDLHDTAYTDLGVFAPLVAFDYGDTQFPDGECSPHINTYLYPTRELEDAFHTSRPTIYAIFVLLIFVFTSAVFVLYDIAVNRRQQKFFERVVKQDKIMTNVFPTTIRDRLISSSSGDQNEGKGLVGMPVGIDFEDIDNHEIFGAAPLAELYPSVTVCFADIAGFTSWSSAREPPQVFMLLETLYGAFDQIAYKHNIFKVETVGDCYVAVAGLPDARDDHAVAVAKFVRDMLEKFNELTYKLEVLLGPDTADLGLRVGLSSGQVTAGVLRGERARFQLFGDTMNTAARMENTSTIGRIQVSPSTAEMLKQQGKSRWTTPRTEPVSVKGKGQMQTYWLLSKDESRKQAKRYSMEKVSSRVGVEMAVLKEEEHENDWDDEDFEEMEGSSRPQQPESILSKKDRLVEWNVKVLRELLQQILAARREDSVPARSLTREEGAIIGKAGLGATVLSEFKPIIELKRFGAKDLATRRDPTSIRMKPEVTNQLRQLILAIAEMYQDNPFHNFEHASHVMASVRKLLTRIVSVDGQNQGQQYKQVNGSNTLEGTNIKLVDLAGHSYGITSDPLTQFAVVFAALIHDVDHPGISNAQLLKEGTMNARLYNKSIAEQNSVALSWELLMRPEYADLRSCIYSTEEELKRFRQLVVNTVMATDIADKELQGLRKKRWETAFSSTTSLLDDESPVVTQDRKATIVIEHLIQASDVSHTMQHWHIYQRWNERLFCEMYEAYLSGRADSDPSLSWYKGEIGFFDFYVIPLAKKLEDCGVFGVSSHEYMNYANANRDEWIREGESIVAAYVENYSAIWM